MAISLMVPQTGNYESAGYLVVDVVTRAIKVRSFS